MNISNYKNIYFIGIGGIGMSALARYFHALGKKVLGYDKAETKLTNELMQEGIEVTYVDSTECLPEFLNSEETLVVITPAIPKSSQLWQYFSEHNFIIKKRAEVLGLITQNSFCLAVAGTHGKTTTSGMLAHILYENQQETTAFLGGILENYQTNYLSNGVKQTVVEADEFDRSFLHLSPNVACVLSTDADHLDIYKNTNSIKESFLQFANKIEDKSKIFVEEHTGISGVTVGFSKTADVSIYNMMYKDGFQVFDFIFNGEKYEGIEIQMPGKHNIINATMAIVMAMQTGLSFQSIQKSIKNFLGVRRRFSFKVRTENKIYIDDYAHHPTEIKAVASVVQEMYADKKILAVFQPHLYSRTRDFLDDFAKSLSVFEHLVLLDIYPAREEPIEGVSSEVLLEKITTKNKTLLPITKLVDFLTTQDFDVLLTMGAGDIGELTDTIKKKIEAR